MNFFLRFIFRLKGVSPIAETLISLNGPSEHVELVIGGLGTRFFWFSEGSGTFLKPTAFLGREIYFFAAGTMPAREDPAAFTAAQVISRHKQRVEETVIACIFFY